MYVSVCMYTYTKIQNNLEKWLRILLGRKRWDINFKSLRFQIYIIMVKQIIKNGSS